MLKRPVGEQQELRPGYISRGFYLSLWFLRIELISRTACTPPARVWLRSSNMMDARLNSAVIPRKSKNVLADRKMMCHSTLASLFVLSPSGLMITPVEASMTFSIYCTMYIINL